ncbi:MAG TPA: ATP-dependent DNA ligase [Burkholderiales bacterium]|nr:ATP-dependent DNA ligase [Burkholderiales bacterium]
MTLLADVVQTSARVAATSSRLAKAAEIAACLRRVSPDEVEVAIGFLSGEIRQGKLAVGYSTLQDARAAPAPVPSLELRRVDAAFEDLKRTRGSGSAERKQSILRSLFEKATAEEQDFLVRLIVGELRQGALEGLMLDALASAAKVPPAALRRAATFAGGVRQVARAALEEGEGALGRFTVQLMQPVLPMLAQPAQDAEEAIRALGTAGLDWKVDGARVQVHKSGDDIKVFTRSLNEVTASVPEIVDAVRSAPARSLILDGEAIALRPDGTPHPFQLTMRRFGRKAQDAALRREFPLSVFFFDCLYRDGSVLIDAPWKARRQALEGALPESILAPSMATGDPAAAAAFYADALRHGHEGIMAKALDSPYEAGRRGGTWLKIKQAHTLDLVVLAAEWGHGRRKGWLSNLHLGARDPRSGAFVMLGKTFKGLTDEMLQWQTAQFLARELRRDEWTVHLRPELVVEVSFNNIQESPQYPGGMALRFARVKRYRPDKRADEADTLDTVRLLFEHQA